MISTDKPAGPAFDQARGWTAHQITQLTEAQRARFEAMKKEEAKRQQQKHKERRATQRQFDEHQKNKRVEQVLNLTPRGVRIPDHVERALALKLRDQRDTLGQMQRQFAETVKIFLKECEQARQTRQQFEKSAARDNPERASPSFEKAAKGLEARQAGEKAEERGGGDAKNPAQNQKDRILARRKAREQAKDKEQDRGQER